MQYNNLISDLFSLKNNILKILEINTESWTLTDNIHVFFFDDECEHKHIIDVKLYPSLNAATKVLNSFDKSKRSNIQVVQTKNAIDIVLHRHLTSMIELCKLYNCKSTEVRDILLNIEVLADNILLKRFYLIMKDNGCNNIVSIKESTFVKSSLMNAISYEETKDIPTIHTKDELYIIGYTGLIKYMLPIYYRELEQEITKLI